MAFVGQQDESSPERNLGESAALLRTDLDVETRTIPVGKQATYSSMLGHYDAGFTLRTHTHATRQKQEEATETIGNFMSQVM